MMNLYTYLNNVNEVAISDLNYLLKSFNTSSEEPTYQNLIKSCKILVFINKCPLLSSKKNQRKDNPSTLDCYLILGNFLSYFKLFLSSSVPTFQPIIGIILTGFSFHFGNLNPPLPLQIKY